MLCVVYIYGMQQFFYWQTADAQKNVLASQTAHYSLTRLARAGLQPAAAEGCACSACWLVVVRGTWLPAVVLVLVLGAGGADSWRSWWRVGVGVGGGQRWRCWQLAAGSAAGCWLSTGCCCC
jgi:hypothetical protein